MANRTPTDAPTAKRLTAQLLSGPPAEDVATVARRLLAIQAQDGRGARLAIRSRAHGLTAGDVDRALTDDRSLLITWLNRGTLHLVRSEDYPWLHALTTPPLHTANARRLEQEGVSPDDAERAVAIVERALTGEGPQTREQLRERVAAAGIRTEGQALIHILLLASLRGLVVRGLMVNGRHAYVLVRDWLDAPPPVDRKRAVSREPLLGSHTGVVTVNGIFRPIALVRGRAVATWTMPKGEVELAPFGRLSRADRAALDVDAEDVKRYLAD